MKEIERKIEESKEYGKHPKNGTEKVPKWSRPQFDDKVLFFYYVILYYVKTLLNVFSTTFPYKLIYYKYFRSAQSRKNFM